MRPEPGQVLHFSEDPTITSFVPRLLPSRRLTTAYVWAVDHRRCPDYWFPRECPRAMAWAEPSSTATDRDRLLGSADRVHAVEYGWLAAMRSVTLYAYRLPAQPFTPLSESDSATYGSPAQVAVRKVDPLGPPEPVGDLLDLHAAAGIELRFMPNLWRFWDAVTASSLGFSGIRMRNAEALDTAT